MTLLFALVLLVILMDRLGYFQPIRKHVLANNFESIILQLAEDIEWEERMSRAAEKLPEIHKMPLIHFKIGR